MTWLKWKKMHLLYKWLTCDVLNQLNQVWSLGRRCFRYCLSWGALLPINCFTISWSGKNSVGGFAFLLCCTTNSDGTFALASKPRICSLEIIKAEVTKLYMNNATLTGNPTEYILSFNATIKIAPSVDKGRFLIRILYSKLDFQRLMFQCIAPHRSLYKTVWEHRVSVIAHGLEKWPGAWCMRSREAVSYMDHCNHAEPSALEYLCWAWKSF